MDDSLEYQLGEYASEIELLASKLGREIESSVRYYQGLHKPSVDVEAEPSSADEIQRALDAPARLVTWSSIAKVADVDPEAGLRLWHRVRDDARKEIDSGHRAFQVMLKGYHFGPLDQARFLEVRAALREEWRPNVGVESMLIDQLAQIQIAWEEWFGRHITEVTMESAMRELERMAMDEKPTWLPRRVSEAEAMTLSASMADRFNRMFLKTLRSLRDLRRMTPSITVQNAGQVNVGSQQVNVSSNGNQQ